MRDVPPEAMAFVRGILAEPADRLRRLVFADWLDEQGGDSNAAWAGYIRTQAELETEADGPRTIELLKLNAYHAGGIRTGMTLPVRIVQSRFLHLPRLLPAEKVTVRLDRQQMPRTILRFLPEAMARLYQVLPIGFRNDHFVIVSSDARNHVRNTDMENFLSVTLVVFSADANEIREAIDQQDWQAESLDAPIEWYDTHVMEWRE